jgi:hypothetical protein
MKPDDLLCHLTISPWGFPRAGIGCRFGQVADSRKHQFRQTTLGPSRTTEMICDSALDWLGIETPRKEHRPRNVFCLPRPEFSCAAEGSEEYTAVANVYAGSVNVALHVDSGCRRDVAFQSECTLIVSVR